MIRITASENIKIYNPAIKEMWGDEIYTGGEKDIPRKNIEVYNVHVDNNKRNTLSITLADSVKLIKPLIANSNEQSFKADIEPGTNQDFINNIVINDPIYGVVVSLIRLSGSISKKINIIINNPLIIH